MMNDSKKDKKDRKRSIFFVTLFNVGILERYLEDMAGKGWLFTGKKGPVLSFEKCRPVKMSFTVDIYKEPSFNENIRESRYPEERNRLYDDCVDLWEEAGWTLIHNDGRLMIFCSEEGNQLPVHRDPASQLAAIVKAFRKESIYPFCVLLIAFLAYLGLSIGYIDAGMLFLLIKSSNLTVALIYMVGSIYWAFDLVQFALFYRKNRARVKMGEALIFTHSRVIRLIKFLYALMAFPALTIIMFSPVSENMLYLAIVLGAFVGFIILLLLTIWLGQRGSGQGTDRNVLIQCIPLGFALIFILGIICSGFGLEGDNSEQLSYTDEDNYTETLTIHHDEIPLSLEDLGVTVKGAAHTDSYATHNSSIFGSLDEYSQSFLNEKLECIGEGMELDIIESSFAFPVDGFVRENRESWMTEWHKGTARELKLWGAEELYTGTNEDGTSYRIVKWEDRALLFWGQDVKIDEKNIAMIKKVSHLSD